MTNTTRDRSMKLKRSWSRLIRAGLLAWPIGIVLSACAQMAGGSTETWKEEVLLHDGTKIVVERTVRRAGRHEVRQRPPIAEQSIAFVLPGTHKEVTWNDPFSKDIGSASFSPMLLDIQGDTAYLVASPAGCLSYNKWGRPNPPYVVFKREGQQWMRIDLRDLPAQFNTPNLIFSSPDEVAKKFGQGIVSAEKIKQLYQAYRQREFKTILREPIPQACEERVLYRGYWILPKDPIARRFIDSQQQR